ncbi:hypothetical protein [uncultured Sphaerotilus sp.]|uniref:hypothetical protein n=1 Tax=uncultured Sphaerotilus sp. TaxID=474984 RepID=UPI0030CA3410
MSATRPITPADWKRIEEALAGRFGSEKLMCDGYKLTISREQEKNKLVLVVYVNGVWKGEWLTNDCEERRRFFCRSERRLFSKARVEKNMAGMGKRQKEKFIAEMGLDKTMAFYMPVWSSFTALRRHLVKNNKEILVLQPEYVVVSGAGTSDQRILSEHATLREAINSEDVRYEMGDVMKRLPDGTLTTKF